MRRRALLGALGTSVAAGCVGDIRHDMRGESRFTIDNDPVPEDFPAMFSADVLGGLTASHPPRIRVRFEYTGDEERTFQFTYPGPFADIIGTAADGSKLVLKYEADSNDRRDDCWKTETPSDRTAVEHRKFHSGGKAHVEWSVLTHETMDACYPSGSYRFEDVYHVDGGAYEWGFHLHLH